jgi:hypothetical protein
MNQDPVQESIRVSLELLEEADREGIKAKRQLTQILGADEPEETNVWLVVYSFYAYETHHRGLMTPLQRDYLARVVDGGADPKAIRDALQELLVQVWNMARDVRERLISGFMGNQYSAIRRAPGLMAGSSTDPVSCTWDPNQCAINYTQSACSRQPNGPSKWARIGEPRGSLPAVLKKRAPVRA